MFDFPILKPGSLFIPLPGRCRMRLPPFGPWIDWPVTARIIKIEPDRLEWYEWGWRRLKFGAKVTFRQLSGQSGYAEMLVQATVGGLSFKACKPYRIVSTERNLLVARGQHDPYDSVMALMPDGTLQFIFVLPRGFQCNKYGTITTRDDLT